MASFWKKLKQLYTGTPATRENVSNLRPEQEGLYNQAVNAGMGPGAGGAFGDAADYYRNNLSDNPADFNAFAAPALRQYNEDIMPGISEQFAGMGAGGLSSSGFRNAQVQGATDLSERLGAIRANLRQSSAQGLQNVGQVGLGNYSQNMETDPGNAGLIETATPVLTAGATAAFGPAAGAAGNQIANKVNNWFGGKGSQVAAKTGPYGSNGPVASPTMHPQPQQAWNPPQYGQGPGWGRGY